MAGTLASRLSGLATGVLVLCALIITALVVRRELMPAAADAGEPAPAFYEGWRKLTAEGARLGPATAPVQIVEFFDYQCPFCRRVQPAVDSIRAKYGDDVAVTFRHFLLEDIHPHARGAAIAAECAMEQGRFASMHSALFANSEQFGILPWDTFAQEAGVPDTAQYRACLEEPRHQERFIRDHLLVQSIGLKAVPALVINGTVVSGAKSFGFLDELVAEALRHARRSGNERRS